MADDEDIEYTILNRRDVNAFKVPPRASADGHRADEWKDCIWQGKVWCVGKGNDAIVRLVKPTGDLFLQSVIVAGEHEKFVERTVDSSRYFVLKVVHPQTKNVAFIGLGFEDRNDAFDFNCCLSDFKDRNVEPEATELFSGEKKDYSLKEGSKITINLKSTKNKAAGNKDKGDTSGNGAGEQIGLFLPPPPSVGATARSSAGAAGGGADLKNIDAVSKNPFGDEPAANPFAAFPNPKNEMNKNSDGGILKESNPFANFEPFPPDGTKSNPFTVDGEDPFAGDDDFFGDFQ